MPSFLKLGVKASLKAENAGLFLSPGHGIHPDRVIPSHELIFVRSGRLEMEVGGCDFEVKAGETLLLHPGVRHRGTRAYEEGLEFYWVHFCLPAKAGKNDVVLDIPCHTQPLRAERLAELFHRFLDDQESRSQIPEQAALLVMLMLLELRRDGLSSPPPSHAMAGRTQQFIAAHFHRGIHAADVARAMGCHPDHLGRVHRQAHGCTLSEAIHRRQLMEARVLLRESAKNMEEIALACGFKETRYFRKLFASHQGMSPRAYRKLHSRIYVNTR
ncbi:MAG: AraC family transcriptional regulator [Opitutaceae bacterium]|jgi:AraC-like DNA-binding protein/mannose-6-phosphate isomerase-like protein (cupin superfamily)